MKEKILHFVVTTDKPQEVHSRFFPEGKTVLNRTEWRGKEPRSCAVTRVKGERYYANHIGPPKFNVEVTYRPNGCINYVGDTRYDGWTLTPLDQKSDGTLLDGKGNELKDGQSPVWLRYEIHKDVDFNEIDFGQFISEVEAEGVKHIPHDDVMREISGAARVSAGGSVGFTAPRRSRPDTKIILTNQPAFVGRDGFGGKVINICNSTPHLDHVLLTSLTSLMQDYLEGRAMVKSVETPDCVFVELSDSLGSAKGVGDGSGTEKSVCLRFVLIGKEKRQGTGAFFGDVRAVVSNKIAWQYKAHLSRFLQILRRRISGKAGRDQLTSVALAKEAHCMPGARNRDDEGNCRKCHGYRARDNQIYRRREMSPGILFALTPVSKTNLPNPAHDQHRFEEEEKAGDSTKRHDNTQQPRRHRRSQRSYYRNSGNEQDNGNSSSMECATESLPRMRDQIRFGWRLWPSVFQCWLLIWHRGNSITRKAVAR